MLQQTQVATVHARFYGPFLKKFPTIEALAAAPQQDVMKAWEGLGYYTRARNLHTAAKAIMADEELTRHFNKTRTNPGPTRKRGGGASAPSIDRLIILPGIGKNTAHAIAAFAYRQPVAILEANVKRIVARVFAWSVASDMQLWAGAETLLNRAEPFAYNQAMMNLGALLCTPQAPNCSACPARGICQGQSAPEHYPTRKAKKQPPVREVTIHVRKDARGRFFLEQRDEKLLGGLYGFAQSPRANGDTTDNPADAIIGRVTHVYSHFQVIGHVHYEKNAPPSNSPDWYTREQINALPLSKLDHKVLALVENCHTARKKKTKVPGTHRKR
jgi:A/G-specific adenine glycosylase